MFKKKKKKAQIFLHPLKKKIIINSNVTFQPLHLIKLYPENVGRYEDRDFTGYEYIIHYS